jgi:putative redox protein
MGKVTVYSRAGLAQEIRAGAHVLVADEPVAAGGTDQGPDPYALLLGALGACTSMTLELYARRKGWPLGEVVVELAFSRVYAEDCEHCEDPRALLDRVDRRIVLHGPLDDAQVARLAEIARKCPIHKTLTAGVEIVDDVGRDSA